MSIRESGRIRTALLGYLGLTKPRVIELLLVTAIPAMLLAHRGTVDPVLILNTLIGGVLAAAGANTLNCVADADIDKLMKRTARRPLPRAAVPTPHALVFGVVLSVASVFWLWVTTNLLSGLLALATITFYVFVYTLGLKRRTASNISRAVSPRQSWVSTVQPTIRRPYSAATSEVHGATSPHGARHRCGATPTARRRSSARAVSARPQAASRVE